MEEIFARIKETSVVESKGVEGYPLPDLVDLESLLRLFKQFSSLFNIEVSLIQVSDLSLVLTTGTSGICKKFHLKNEKSRSLCQESLSSLVINVAKSRKKEFKQCPHGLEYCAIPIVINDYCLAVLLAGQVLYRKPDEKSFSRFAAEYGYDQSEYLNILSDVAIVNEKQFSKAVELLLEMSVLIAEEGISRYEANETKRAKTQSDKRYRTYFQCCPDAVLVIDNQGNLLEVNEGAVKHLGYSETDLTQMNLFELLPESAEDTALELLKQLREKGAANLESACCHRDGHEIDISIDAASLGSDEYIIFASDISARKEAELENKQRFESFLMAFQDNPSPMVLMSDRESEILKVNSAFCSFVSLEESQLVNKNPQDPELEDFFQCNVFLEKVNDQSEINNLSVDFLAQDGLRRHAVMSAKRFDLAGKSMILVVYHDISGRIAAEKALKASEQRIRTITDNIPGAVYQVQFYPDRPAVFSFVSNGFRELHEIEPDDVIRDSRVLMRQYHPDDIQAIKTATLEAYLSKSEWDLEFRIITPSGQLKWIHATATPYRDDDGKTLWTGFARDTTDRRQSLERLEQSQQKLSFYFRRNPLAYIEFNPSMEVIDWNDTAESIFGYTKDEVVGRHIFDLIVPRCFHIKMMDIYNGLINQSGGNQAICNNHDKQGESVICEWYNTAITNEFGEVTGIASLVQDITQRLGAEQALKASEQRFKDIAQSASDWFWETDSRERFSYISQRYFDIVGVSKSRVIGKSFPQLLKNTIPEEGKSWDDMEIRVKKHEEFKNLEFRLSTDGGKLLWLRISGTPFFDDEGEYLGYRGIGTDISEQKLAEKALILSEQRFRDIAESTSDWFWETDEKLFLTYISERYFDISRGGSNEIIGQPLTILFGESFESGIEARFAHELGLVEKKQIRDYEYRFIDDEGNEHWFSISGKACFDQKCQFIGYRGTGSNITERKKVEFELKRYQEQLEQLVEEQTSEIRTAKEAADLTNQAKTDFLLNLSESLRNPMHAILGFSDLLSSNMDELSDDKIQQYIRFINVSGKRLLPFLNDLMDISRLELGGIRFTYGTSSLYELAVQAVDDLKTHAKGIDNVVFNIIEPDFSTRVFCDSARMIQVFQNLYSNAIKFSSEQAVVLITFRQCSIQRYDKGSEQLLEAIEVNVCDEGVGIPESELDTIFDLFVLSSKTRSGYGGAGLGLPICREIVEAHRGRIYAGNAAEGGAILTFQIPVHSGE